jgi:hypothetical protein
MTGGELENSCNLYMSRPKNSSQDRAQYHGFMILCY